MRVTLASSFQFMQTEIGRINEKTADLQKQAATGKKINEVSDDPTAVRPILNYRTQIESSDRYTRNMDAAKTGLKNYDYQLGRAFDLLVQAKEQTVAAGNGALRDEDMATMGKIVEGLREELLGVANSQSDGRYIFAGYEEDTKPFADDGTFNGDDNTRTLEIAPGEEVDISVSGKEVFASTTPDNIFETLQNISTAMKDPAIEIDSNDVESLQEVMDTVSSTRADVGTRINRLESAVSYREKAVLDMKEFLSDYEDADIVEVSSQLMQQETSLKAALAVTTKIGQLSLLDYM
ncbi:flagellar hook-associated protein FlgL [Desulfohalobium retbaense]|uniref:Flagellar hook-associated protein 3 n=1 Tax=Desulfohalobium retbaense (strain ATCC 49708 / DSM 5692 / JCM 16813 / HR100) TaxID=485915 RepID=C8WYY4_DESRD|nr:flagellar hook-associated protein FlgL [Desulfohalobium retbaense]ACV67900.1 flagellar hook-associated protein 3 [Desulfohalobium retbaense DSM 5692]